MGKSIPLSPKHGLNPTLAVCFWCGEETGEIALMGRIGGAKDEAAPKHTVISYEPCAKCKGKWAQGFTMLEATRVPNSVTSVPMQDGVYPTGRLAVITPQSAKRMFDNDVKGNKAFFTPGDFMAILGDNA